MAVCKSISCVVSGVQHYVEILLLGCRDEKAKYNQAFIKLLRELSSAVIFSCTYPRPGHIWVIQINACSALVAWMSWHKATPPLHLEQTQQRPHNTPLSFMKGSAEKPQETLKKFKKKGQIWRNLPLQAPLSSNSLYFFPTINFLSARITVNTV